MSKTSLWRRITHCERGVALLATIFITSFMVVSLAAAFTLISSERRIIDNAAATITASSIAQTGLETFLAERDSLGFVTVPPAVYESTRVDITGGYADIVLQEVAPSIAGSKALYVIRSLGVLTDPTLPGLPQAQRAVAQLAQWQTGTIDVRAGWMSLTGLHKNGTAGSISGVDRCGMQPDVAGISVPNPPGFTKSGNFNPTGSPGLEDLGTAAEAVDSVHIDWAGILDGSSFTPDIVYNGSNWPSFADPNYWPSILANGNLALPGSGRGILMVTGDLSISGNVTWDGIVLVGNQFTSNGNNKVYGTTMTGMNVLLAADPDSAAAAIGQTSVGNGNKTYQYDSCSVASAMNGLGGLTALSNAWWDNWATY